MRHLIRRAGGAAMALAPGLALALAASAVPAEAEAQTTVQTSGTILVEGGSTVRSWDCETEDLRFEVALSEAGLDMEALEDAVTSLVLRVPTAALACGDDTMDRHMWDALETEDHPWVVFRMEGYEATPSEEGVALVLTGTLEMVDETRSVRIEANAEPTEGGIRVTGMHALDMTEWGISPPRLMLGTLRVRDDVEVHFDVVLTPGG